MRRRLPAAFVVDLAREVLGRGGVLGLVVRGHSMQPTLLDGARVVIAARTVQLGAVVLALTDSGPCLHRVSALQDRGGRLQVLLRGDRTPRGAIWVDVDQIVGTLVAHRRTLRSLRGQLGRMVHALRRAA